MNNTVLVESKLRRRLKLASTLMGVFCICFIVFLVCVFMIGKQNLSGQTNEVTGILNEVYIESSNTIAIDENKHYNVVWDDKENNVDLNNYLGKSITLIITSETFGASNPWALGLIMDGQTIVDYNTTLAVKTSENNEIKTVIIAVTVILCVATCALFIWRFNIQPTTEHELYKEFADFLSQRQPTCEERKVLIWSVGVYFILIVALLITAIVIDPNADTIPELAPAAKAVLWAMLAFGIVGSVALIGLNAWVARKEIDFYAENLPFDFSDISHAPLRKKVKEELQKEILKEREEHPYTYADGGNGYDVTFGEKGVTLSIPYDDLIANNETQITSNMPSADAVFADVENTESSDEILSNVAASANNERMFLSYDELNFEAVARYRKSARPMIIIIKSRLERNDSYPEEFINDIHIALDLNLLNTLNAFNVKVENLDYLMQNKKQLMSENCLIIKKSKQK